MKVTIPEHVELHQELVMLARAPGRAGKAARRVADLLHRHFVAVLAMTELTPAQKVTRKVVAAKYQAFIETLYR